MAREIELGFGPLKESDFCSNHRLKIDAGFEVVRYGIKGSKSIGILCIDCWPQARALFDEMASHSPDLDVDTAIERIKERYKFLKDRGIWPASG